MRETGYQWSRHEKVSGEDEDEEVASNSANSRLPSSVGAGGDEGVATLRFAGGRRERLWMKDWRRGRGGEKEGCEGRRLKGGRAAAGGREGEKRTAISR